MAVQRKHTPSRSTPLGTNLTSRAATPLPESRQRPTASGLDARKMGTRSEAEEVLTDPSGTDPSGLGPSPRSSERATGRFGSVLPVDDRSREVPTEPASPPSERQRISIEPTQSVGYYSLRTAELEAVRIPRAPRVPSLEFDPLDEGPAYRRPTSSKPMPTSRRTLGPDEDVDAPVLTMSQAPETIRTPPPSVAPKRQRTSAPPPPMQESLAPPVYSDDLDEEFDSLPPPPVYFAPHVRAQAGQWAQTGSLSLPGCSSPRHARALQRALLLALLHEPGWFELPQGLRQRAGWLFCDGWESAAGSAHPFREIDDLAAVLGLPCSRDTRHSLSKSIASKMPDDFASRRSPSSAPPTVR